MDLGIKQAAKEVFQLKYFKIFAIFYTIVSSICAYVSNLTGTFWDSILIAIIYLLAAFPLGYYYKMNNGIINGKEVEEDLGFKKTFLESGKIGLKGFVGIYSLILGILAIEAVILIALTVVVMTLTDLQFPYIMGYVPFIILFSAIIIAVITSTVLVMDVLPVLYSQEFKIKDFFRFKKVFNLFKANSKKVLLIILLYFAFLVLGLLILGTLFMLFDTILQYASNRLLINQYVILETVINLTIILAPIVISFVKYFAVGILFNILSKNYKNGLEFIEKE